MWDLAELADLALDALRKRALECDQEQAPFGIDVLDEREIHPILTAAWKAAGYGVHREQRYPADAARQNRAMGDRCDVVLTPQHVEGIIDPLAANTLFAHLGVDPSVALWVEVKVVAQFAALRAGAGPNPGYAAQLGHSAMQDVRKLTRDPAILNAAVLIVVFTDTTNTAEHDLAEWHGRGLSRGLGVSLPYTRSFVINDRIGNGACTLGLFRVTRY